MSKELEVFETYVSAKTVANEFLRLGQENKRNFTNMQLQKLVYIAGGFHMTLLKSDLYYEDTEAWRYGPVIPELYDSLKNMAEL